MPTVGSSRYDGLKPATPQKLAGRITEPPVWVPVAIGKKPAATPAAEPDDEPPGVCARLCGLRVLPGSRWANSVVTVLPISDAAVAADQRHQRGIGLRAVAEIDRRAVFGRHVGGVENILQPDRQAAQRLVLDAGRLRGRARAGEVERDEGADLALALGDGVGAEIERVGGGEFAGFDGAGKTEG